MNFPNIKHIDWVLVAAMVPLFAAGLVTMHSFTGADPFFTRQLIWIAVGLLLFFVISFVDVGFLKDSRLLISLFVLGVLLLGGLFLAGTTVKGATSWFSIGGFTLQPADPIKLIMILVLAKYFSRRHVAIGNIKHIIISGLYMFVPFVLVFFQPDLGSALILASVWFGMILVSGISKEHLFLLLSVGVIAILGVWLFVLEPYQKNRIMSFLQPLEDVQGSGYNAYQSAIAVGSGQFLGKGVGYGTQSRLEFLPEYQTDFIFAAFAEEWGFVGAAIILMLYGIIIWRILKTSSRGANNFHMLYGIGVAILFFSHAVINIGMNINILPVTGLPLPLMSYGGSHIVTECLALGILMSMRRNERPIHKEALGQEFEASDVLEK